MSKKVSARTASITLEPFENGKDLLTILFDEDKLELRVELEREQVIFLRNRATEILFPPVSPDPDCASSDVAAEIGQPSDSSSPS